jgi:hypothetical protein
VEAAAQPSARVASGPKPPQAPQTITRGGFPPSVPLRVRATLPMRVCRRRAVRQTVAVLSATSRTATAQCPTRPLPTVRVMYVA